MKKIIIVLLFLVLVPSISAQELEKINLPAQVVNPGDFYYSAIRLWEKITERFQFNNDAKFRYSSSLIDKRVSELIFVIKDKRLDEVQRSSERLAYQVGVLTEFLIKQKSSQEKEQLRAKINGFLPALSELRDAYPANSSYWMLVQHDINSFKEYSEKLK
ncbi:hypothetical protein HYW41_01885 [Candidatus Daviesbacteria bacterium]|nr:hypothetical protein [Candidatus Daviesbacteria bacterium]